ncbi:MAG: endonuclease/exonuclease/phosphatase family protein, partial [Alloprevotella sp.]|nr:endonuclease/exonuclease/phosphatase family protein [Bacteroidales bacterium]MDY5087374.1 endonuclease/exonuclease/phosphatase family protein [Alloprevotella sp.]
MTQSAQRRHFVQSILCGAAWCVALLLVVCAYMPMVNPERWPLAGVITLFFPIALLLHLTMLVLVLLFIPRTGWMMLAAIVVCFPSLRAYCPINLPSPPPKGALKVITYNTQSFGNWQLNPDGSNPVTSYLVAERADVVCLQEAYDIPANHYAKTIGPAMRPVYAHYDTVKIGPNVLACFSRMPIVSKRLIAAGASNGSALFVLQMPDGDSLFVINCHLESMHLTPDDRNHYKQFVHHPGQAEIDSSSHRLLGKVADAAVRRALQARATAEAVRALGDRRIIVCGDMNDTPISYTHHCLTSAGLRDAYAATGRGIGRSFNRDAIYVRIDHMFCSSSLRPYDAHIDRQATA